VLLDAPPGLDAAALARRVCDRHRGIGADGLLIAHPGGDGADVTMELRNADGGRAETSGNGIRCFAQAVWDDAFGDRRDLIVATDAGVKVVRRIRRNGPDEVDAAVDMGQVKIIDEPRGWGVEHAAVVDVGNPHLVLYDARSVDVDPARRGPEIEATFPHGINVEWTWRDGDGLAMRVWERGAGVTEACGTGSCAVAAAAHSWGLVGARTVVHNPGGPVTVELGDDGTATLIGPAVRIAEVELSWP